MKQLSFESSGQILFSTPFVVIDCETTGVSPDYDAITEIAAIAICSGEQIGSFHSLVNPERKLSDHIIRLTSITNEELVGAPTIAQVIPSLLEFIGDKIIIGHNVKFDIGFINSALRRHSYQTLANNHIDTLTISRKLLMNEVRNFKLSTLAQHIKTENQPTHRAYADVLATIDLFHHLIERSSSLGVKGVNDFIKIPSKRNRSRYSKRVIAKDAPSAPGIYMFTAKDQILYIGKSRNIKERLRSYFISDDRSKISKLISSAEKIEYVVTPTPTEARILELRALQLYRPEYNRADLNESKFHYLALNEDDDIPTLRLQKYNQKTAHQLLYGPFTTRNSALEFKDTLQFLFGLRNCSDIVCDGMKRPLVPCINSLQGMHSCFCFGDMSDKDGYLERVKNLCSDLPQNYPFYTARLLDEMNKYSKDLRFERAKQYFEYSVALQKWMNRFNSVSNIAKLNIKNSINTFDVIGGRAVVNMDSHIQSDISDSVIVNMELINNDISNSLPVQEVENYGFGFVSPPKEFKERLTLAYHLERLNLLNK